MTRREFTLTATGVTAASVSARAYSEIRGANDRVRIGVIGCGTQAADHLRNLARIRSTDNLEILQVSDVYQPRAERAAQTAGAKVVKDYHAILDNKDIDYVLIATPEHWHYRMAMDAIDARKHVYLEKPMTQTSQQAKQLAAKVKASGLKLQVGVQGMSDDSYEAANKCVREGVLGKVVLAQIDYSRNARGDFWTGRADPNVKPGVNLDWNAWLGPARKRPYDTDRFMHWRRYWDYSGGIATDLFVHRITRIIKSLGLTFPEHVSAAGGKFEFKESAAEIPDTLNILLDYPGGPTVQLISSMASSRPVEHLLRGHKACLEFNRTGFVIRPEPMFAKEVELRTHRKTGGEVLDLHHRNLLNAIRKNEALKCDAMLGYYGVVAVEMGNLSYRKRKYMKWDAAKEKIVAA